MATGSEDAPGIHRVADAFVNFYVVEDVDGVTVVDAGVPASYGTLKRLLEAVGRRPDDVRAVVLTHAHFDHVGFAEIARRELGVPVLCHEDEVWLTRHPWRYKTERSPLRYVWKPDRFAVFSRFLLGGAARTPRIAEVSTFRDGEQLNVPGRPRVVATPGHTFGHVAFHLPDRDALIAGDALVTLDPYTRRTGPRLVARAATADLAQARASLGRIAETGARHVLPGHGETWHGGAAGAAEAAAAAGSA